MSNVVSNIQHVVSKCSTLLSPEEEKILFTRLAVAKKVVEKLEKKRKRTRIESSQLGIARRQIKELRKRIVTANIALVVAMSKRTYVANVSRDDLISEGLIKLLQCVDKFNLKLGYKFSTYFCRALFNVFARAGFIESKQHNGRVKIDEADFQKMYISESDPEPIEGILSLREALRKNSANLTPIESCVIENLFGPKPKTSHEVGLLIGLTKGRVGQIKNDAVEKLRSVLKE